MPVAYQDEDLLSQFKGKMNCRATASGGGGNLHSPAHAVATPPYSRKIRGRRDVPETTCINLR